LLQVVFVGAVPGHDLIHGWHGVSFSSPFAQLAVAANPNLPSTPRPNRDNILLL
jgi:hypothetical protein